MSVAMPRVTTRGVVFVHSTPTALCPHIIWALESVLDRRVTLDWTPQPAGAATGARASCRGQARPAPAPARLGPARLGQPALRGDRGAEPGRRRLALVAHPRARHPPHWTSASAATP